MNKQSRSKVKIKTAPGCNATGFKYFLSVFMFFKFFYLKTEICEASRVTPKYCP